MWYVSQTTAGQEDKTIEQCKNAIPATVASLIFSPSCEYMRRYQGSWHVEVERLFPGYVFMESESPKELEKYLKRISGVVTPVIIGGGFHPLRKDEQEFMKNMLDENFCLRFSVGYIVDGELVVERGPLREKTACVKKIDRHRRRAELLFHMFDEDRTASVGLEVKAKLTSEEYRYAAG